VAVSITEPDRTGPLVTVASHIEEQTITEVVAASNFNGEANASAELLAPLLAQLDFSHLVCISR